MKFKSNNKSKVFVGPNNSAGNASLIALALRTVGVKADSYCYTQHAFGYKTNFVIRQISSNNLNKFWEKLKIGFFISKLNSLLRISFFLKVLIKYDTFIFISTSSVFRYKNDLKVLKYFKKKIAFIFIGCPERNPTSMINNSDSHYCTVCTDEKFQRSNYCNDIDQKRKIIEYISRHADYIYALQDLVDFLPKNQVWNRFYVIANELEDAKSSIIKKYTSTKIINITHLPTNKILKGTNIIEEAMRKICNKYGDRINYTSTKLSNAEVLETLKNTHILIDQMHGYYALLSVEAMSLGCVVLCRMPSWHKEGIQKSPIVNISESNIYNKIESLINDEEKMKRIAEKSVQYYNRYHSPYSVGTYYKKIMNLN